jgi:serine phosphatase RsbU (regulator of sigma subunit)
MPSGRSFTRYLLIFLALLSAAGAARQMLAQNAPSLLVTGLGRGTVLLDGPWQFQTGDNPAWAFPEADDSRWEQIEIGRPWGEQGHYAYSGFAWYRRHLTFGSSAAGYQPNPDEIALYIAKADCTYEVYWNGRLVSPSVSLPATSAHQFSPARALRLGPAEDGVLAIRVWTVPLDSSASGADHHFSQTPRLGNFEAVSEFQRADEGNDLKANLVNLVQMLIDTVIAILGSLVWLRNRDQKLVQWTVFFFVSSILTIFTNPTVLQLQAGTSVLFLYPVRTLEEIALWYLLIYLFDLNRNPRLMRWTRIFAWISILAAVADAILFYLPWSSYHVSAFQVLDAIFTFVFSLIAIYPLIFIPIALRRRPDTSRLLVGLAAFLSEMYDAVQHAAMEGQRFTHWTVGDAMLSPVFTFAGVPVAIPSLLSTLLVCSIVYALYRFTIEQGEAQTALQQEFKSAQELQRVLIPEQLPALPGYAITSAYRPAAEVGGDFFQLIPLNDGRSSNLSSVGHLFDLQQGSALLVIGDVSGKGLKAAMAVSMIVGALRTLAEISDDPGTILTGLNRRIVGRLRDGFVTCLILRINEIGECALANAGHLAPFLNRAEMPMEGSLPLGIHPEASYESVPFRLGVGDRLTLFTDGLLEARNAAGEVFGFERMAALLATRPDASQAVSAAVEFGQEDDITVLALTRLATGVESTTLLIAPRLVAAHK